VEGLVVVNPVDNVEVHLFSVFEADLNPESLDNILDDIWVICLAAIGAFMCSIDGLLEALVAEVVCRVRMHVAVELDDVTVFAKADATVGHDVLCYAQPM